MQSHPRLHLRYDNSVSSGFRPSAATALAWALKTLNVHIDITAQEADRPAPKPA